MSLLLLVAHDKDDELSDRERRAKELLDEAKRRREEADQGKDVPGVKVDKYFGTKLPPVCARLGCYLSDDGARFYCVNSACQKHRKRATKHTRRGRPAKKSPFVYFRCPRCESKRVEMNLFANQYQCRTCKHVWNR